MFGTAVAEQLHREVRVQPSTCIPGTCSSRGLSAVQHRMYGEVPTLVSDCVEFLKEHALEEVGGT